MTTKSTGKNSALKYLESLSGGRLSIPVLLRTLRECDGQSQATFARRLGVSRQHLCDIEKGRKGVTGSRAANFALKLGYPPAYFLDVAINDELRNSGMKMRVRVELIA